MTKIWCILTVLAVIITCQGWAQAANGRGQVARSSASFVETLPADIADDANEAAIAQVIATRIMVPYADGSFRPDETVTEEAFAKIMERFQVICPSAIDPEFVPANRNAEISRIRVIVVLLRATTGADDVDAIVDPSGKVYGFIDGQNVPGWALKAMAYALENGIVKESQRLRPLDAITRSELAAMICNTLTFAVKAEAQPAPAKKSPYTSLVIDCRGFKLTRSISPLLLCEDGCRIYPDPKNVPSMDYIEDVGVVLYARAMDRCKKIGANPLVVQAVGTTGINRQAAIVSEEDRDLILQAEKNSGFLAKWNVIFLKD